MLLIQQAYGVGKDRITGAPDWLNSEHYDIEAKMEGAAAEELKTLSTDIIRAARQHMLRKLLEQRFELTLHRDTKELPVYNLVVAKGGSKLQESKPDDNAERGDKPTDPALAAALASKMGSSGGPSAVAGGWQRWRRWQEHHGFPEWRPFDFVQLWKRWRANVIRQGSYNNGASNYIGVNRRPTGSGQDWPHWEIRLQT